MALPDDLRTIQESLNDLYGAVQEQKELVKDETELEDCSEASYYIEDAQVNLDFALSFLRRLS